MTDTQQDNEQPFRRLVELAKLPATTPLESVTLLNLSGCDLDALPTGFETAFPNLSILFLSNNRFQEMPAVVGQCPKLQMVAFKSNHMTSIHPEALQPQLRWLILTDNLLTTIPDTIGRCTKLQKCMLAGNQLTTLPVSMTTNCTNLELIRLASNKLEKPPTALLQLPRLAWVALSDNPFWNALGVSDDETQAASSTLPLLEGLEEAVLEKEGEILGQGAGGTTRKIVYQNKPVAVKTAAANMTSDGHPDHERAINCALSGIKSAKALIQVLGRTVDDSLVMEFLDNFATIAGPPSLESCSRDAYTESQKESLTIKQGTMIVSTLLQALAELHRAGICHGDFYGHNILIHGDDPTNVRLSDFGAAFFYKSSSENSNAKEFGTLLERVEMRSFVIFVEEVNNVLVHHLKADDDDNAEKSDEALRRLVDYCRAADNGGFDATYIWWKQQQLARLAQEFGKGVDESGLVEEKEP